MKNFTCLLLVLLATSYIIAPNCPSEAANAFHAFLKADAAFNAATTAGSISANGAAGTAVAGVCGASGVLLCCTGATLPIYANTKLANLKTAFTGFGAVANKFGAALSKMGIAAAYSNIDTLLASVATDLSLSIAQAKAILNQYSTASAYTMDFDAFKTQLPECFTYYSMSYQKILCHACMDAGAGSTMASDPFYAVTAGATTAGEVKITAASCSEWVGKCGKVWNFLYKVSNAVTVAAYVATKKAVAGKTYTTANLITATPPASMGNYNQVALSADLTALMTGMTNCGADSSVGTCVAADKAAICKSFIKLFDATYPSARTDVALINADYPTVLTRRLLPTVSTGIVYVDAGTAGVDLTSANTAVTGLPASPTTLLAADVSAWSSGYVAPAGTGSASGSGSGSGSASGSGAGTTSSTSKSAKVVIGTILSALFAVALLN